MKQLGQVNVKGHAEPMVVYSVEGQRETWRTSQRAMRDKIRIGDCRFGKGVFARSTIHKGEEILRFAGPLINLEEATGQRRAAMRSAPDRAATLRGHRTAGVLRQSLLRAERWNSR